MQTNPLSTISTIFWRTPSLCFAVLSDIFLGCLDDLRVAVLDEFSREQERYLCRWLDRIKFNVKGARISKNYNKTTNGREKCKFREKNHLPAVSEAQGKKVAKHHGTGNYGNRISAGSFIFCFRGVP